MSSLTEEDLEAAALYQARVAQQNAALIAAQDPTAAALLRHHDAAIMEAWASQQHAHQHMQHMAAQHAAVRALSRQTGLGSRAADLDALRSIPLGFFRDPQGKTWAANLEHGGSGAADPVGHTSTRETNVSAAGAAARAAARARNRMAREDVIDISSDTDEEEEESKSSSSQLPRIPQQTQHGANSSAANNNHKTQAIVPRPSSQSMQADSRMAQDDAASRLQRAHEKAQANARALLTTQDLTQDARAPNDQGLPSPQEMPFFLKKLAEAAKRAPGTYQTHPPRMTTHPTQVTKRLKPTPTDVPAPIVPHHPAPLQQQQTQLTVPSVQEMRDRHEFALKVVEDSKATPRNHESVQAEEPLRPGPFVQRWLSGSVDPNDQDRALSACIDKVLMSTTGYTKATAPGSLPFPPAEITLDMEQLEEVALDIMQERHSAISSAVKRAYSEMLGRHEEQMVVMKKAELRYKSRQDQALLDVARAQQTISKMRDEVASLQKEADEAKEAAAEAKKTQSKSLETMMKASILSLRMIRKNERQ